MDDPNITMEEYIQLEEEKACRRGQAYNWETAMYDKIFQYGLAIKLGTNMVLSFARVVGLTFESVRIDLLSGRFNLRRISLTGVEVNLRGLLELDKSDLSATCHSKDSGPSQGLYLCLILLRHRCIRTEQITPDLICPLTYQLLRNSSGYSGPDLSFEKLASPERLFSLAGASLAEVSKPVLSFGCSGGDYTSSTGFPACSIESF
ncbi:hypothetical protein Tco_1042135 [Tanacetum coccineum]|uniref:Uncharacterized protein n=1 Tax=Tanacetum coccineum TaxID=301880 RepID=A0ABQ5GI70_9ASTR